MGMSIDKAILRVQHSSMSVDDKETADFIINTMRNYQKITEIMSELHGDFYGSYLKDRQTLEKIYEVL